ncbi:MAG: EamA family transporter RarD [Deltaproteobacteria bacterium]|nr:EamA family transporter RarD [Deltaproteobacteria bacterium]
MTEHRKGLLAGVLAYALWGGVAAYWKLLAGVGAIELIAHRALWALGAFALLVALSGQLAPLGRALRDLRVLGVMTLSGALLAVNWGIFVWATISGHLLDASLGYFINPLISVALGTIFLRERLSRLQWIAIALAAAGVAILTWRAGGVPWVALILAFTFGAYGLVRKTARVDALVGSTVETVLMVPFALGYLLWIADRGALGHADLAMHLLLVGTGIVTAVPLVLFTVAARRLPLSTVGFLQYLAPTGQFLLAAIAFGEPVSVDRLLAFVVIWTGLAVFSFDLWRRRPAAAP